MRRHNDVNLRNKHGGATSALYLALQTGSLAMINMLLNAGADVNVRDAQDWCPLHKATFMENDQVELCLLSHNAEPNAQNMKGVTSLHLCVTKLEKNAEKIAKCLLQFGANANIADKSGTTPFMAAIHSNKLDLMALMLAYNADVSLPDASQRPPLYVASMRGSVAMVKMLLNHGADVNQTCKAESDWTPLMIAIKLQHHAVVDQLLKRGADVNKQSRQGVIALTLALRSDDMTSAAKLAQNCSARNIYRVRRFLVIF